MNAKNVGSPGSGKRLVSPGELAASREVFVIKWGLVYHIVCAPADMPVAEVEAATNAKSPTGISSAWKLPEEPFIDDPKSDWRGTNKLDCPDCSGRSHYLLSC